MYDTLDEHRVIGLARGYGFQLLQRELDTGQLVWLWASEDRDRSVAQFLTRGQALAFMEAEIARRNVA